MANLPLNEEERAKLYVAQMASLERGDEYLAGTQLPTADYGWWLLDNVVVRDESGLEQAILKGEQH